jgi:cytochrome c oxidase subunit 1
VDVYTFFEGNGLDGFNLVASIAAFVLVAGVLLELCNAAYSYHRGVAAGHDPWGGATLEWFALSPPPEHNFDAVPDVRSAEPLLDIRRSIRERTDSWRPPPPAPVPAPAEAPAETSSSDASEGPSVA